MLPVEYAELALLPSLQILQPLLPSVECYQDEMVTFFVTYSVRRRTRMLLRIHRILRA